jgi:hypothetical protein
VDLFEETPGKRTIAAILGGIAAVAFLGLALLGGQTSSILSNVGNAIGVPDERTGSNSSGGGDTVEPPTGTASGGTTDRQVADADAIAPELLIIRRASSRSRSAISRRPSPRPGRESSRPVASSAARTRRRAATMPPPRSRSASPPTDGTRRSPPSAGWRSRPETSTSRPRP